MEPVKAKTAVENVVENAVENAAPSVVPAISESTVQLINDMKTIQKINSDFSKLGFAPTQQQATFSAQSLVAEIKALNDIREVFKSEQGTQQNGMWGMLTEGFKALMQGLGQNPYFGHSIGENAPQLVSMFGENRTDTFIEGFAKDKGIVYNKEESKPFNAYKGNDINRKLTEQYSSNDVPPPLEPLKPLNLPQQNEKEWLISLNPDDPVDFQEYSSVRNLQNVKYEDIKKMMTTEIINAKGIEISVKPGANVMEQMGIGGNGEDLSEKISDVPEIMPGIMPGNKFQEFINIIQDKKFQEFINTINTIQKSIEDRNAYFEERLDTLENAINKSTTSLTGSGELEQDYLSTAPPSSTEIQEEKETRFKVKRSTD